MKKFFRFACMAFSVVAMTLTSCSSNDDDSEIKPDEGGTLSKVFPNGVPASVNGASITVNEKGQVTKIANQDGGDDIVFEYGEFSRAGKFDVRMYMVDPETGEKGDMFYVRLNKEGFASYVAGIDIEDDEPWCEFQFSYNKDGQLENVKELGDRGEINDEFRLYYTDGNITKIVEVDEEDEKYNETVNYYYTTSKYKNPISNKGCIMLFSQGDMFEIDLDDFEWAYYAGLLGKATKDVPLAYDSNDKESYEEFDVKFNSNNMLIEFESTVFVWK